MIMNSERFIQILTRPAISISIILIFIVLWIVSGMLTREAPELSRSNITQPMKVAIEGSTAVEVEKMLILQGSIEPDLRIIVRAETSGQISKVPIPQGNSVKPDDIMARIDIGDRKAKLHRAEAGLQQAQSDYNAGRELIKGGHIPRLEVETKLSRLRAAQAELEAIKLDIERTDIKAPIAGFLNRNIVEQGERVAIGDGVAEIVRNDPLVAVVYVPQNAIRDIATEAPARVIFFDEEVHAGHVSYIEAVADPGTRTFRVEVDLPNPQNQLPSGVSVLVKLPIAAVKAHQISPAILVLSDTGKVGVMIADAQNIARFRAIRVIRSEADGLWIAGLEDHARFIITGQGFIDEGERVAPVEVSESSVPSADGIGSR